MDIVLFDVSVFNLVGHILSFSSVLLSYWFDFDFRQAIYELSCDAILTYVIVGGVLFCISIIGLLVCVFKKRKLKRFIGSIIINLICCLIFPITWIFAMGFAGNIT